VCALLRLSARFSPVLGFLAWTLVGQGACATETSMMAHGESEPGAKPIDEGDFHCARAIMGGSSPYRMPLAGPERDPALTVYLDPLPYDARRAALAAGLEPAKPSLPHPISPVYLLGDDCAG
jgi:hypothetical protein